MTNDPRVVHCICSGSSVLGINHLWSMLVSAYQSMRGINKHRWNFRKADWPKYTAAIERSIPLIPMNSISIKESYQRFRGAVMKAAHFSIPSGFRPRYIPCLDEEIRFCLTSLRKLLTQKLLTIWSSHWMLLAVVVGKRQVSRWILQSQVARAGHSYDVLGPLKTHEEQAILQWKLTPSLLTCFR